MNRRMKKKKWKQKANRELGKLIKDKRLLKQVVSTTARSHFKQKYSLKCGFWDVLLVWMLFEGWEQKE